MLWLVDKLDIILSFFSISDRMADSIKEEPDLKEIDIKDKIKEGLSKNEKINLIQDAAHTYRVASK